MHDNTVARRIIHFYKEFYSNFITIISNRSVKITNYNSRNKEISSSACASPSLSIASAYDQFNSQIKSEDDWKDWKDGVFSAASVSSPSGSFANNMSTNNLSTGSISVTFTPPPLPMSNIQNTFTNSSVATTAQTNMISSTGSFSSSSSSGGNMFQAADASSTPMMQNSTYFESNNASFPSESNNSFGSECNCRTNYTCSKCFQKAMDM